MVSKTENFNSEFYTLTCIDTATNLVELARIDTKSSDAIAGKFEQTWLDQYPRLCVIHDNGGKFTGYAFTQLLCLLGIRDVPITSKNPQSNALYEQMHQTMAMTLLLSQPPQRPQDVLHLVDDGLATTLIQ